MFVRVLRQGKRADSNLSDYKLQHDCMLLHLEIVHMPVLPHDFIIANPWNNLLVINHEYNVTQCLN